MKPKVISVITAKGGSKRLPGKNIIPFGGKPLLAYTIEASLKSKYVDTTVVSTNYENIRKVALQYGAEAPFLRPPELSTDTAHSPDAVEHAVSFYERNFNRSYEITIMLQPTSPFRTAKHIDEAMERFFEDPTLDSLMSINREEFPPWWIFKIEGNRVKELFKFKEEEDVFRLERQQFPSVYRQNGAIYITKRGYLAKTKCIVSPDNNGYYMMLEEDSIDIDTQIDLYVAEAQLAKNNLIKKRV